MLIKMKRTDTGSPDGLHTIVYGVGRVYDVPDDLGRELIKKKSAREVKENGEK